MAGGLSTIEMIQKEALRYCRDLRINDVRMGSSYNAVELEDGNTGIAYSFMRGTTHINGISMELSSFKGKMVSEILEYLSSSSVYHASLGLATVNAICNREKPGLIFGNILEHLNINESDTVGMVGNFRPILPRILKITGSVYIFEQIQKRQGNILPEQDAYNLLPECDVALISSTSIINHTIDRLLKSASSCRETVLLGASTPLLPSAFWGANVTFLSGILVKESSRVLEVVSKGGGVRAFGEFVVKVNIDMRSFRNYTY